ncbi:hypothetical protein [Sphingorhabdus lacus]|uniref:DUF1579 domain-containing protein n=1 Tax=Sphingorhabdus lacus TaxID=392610 RepID=A0A6I6L9F7_9SPHN|nr:hypothetical protein [Sphingorhabdus lacus]QGY80727.1 hypothetical protein EUU25_08910 [Sphingorhabdus lacus]
MMEHIRRGIWLTAALVAVSGCVSRAEVQAGPPGTGCTDPVYRQLDFKIGEFKVTGIGGEPAGESKVESVLGGCLLVEHWRGAISGFGRAHMFFDKSDQLWRLIYVTDDGATMYLSGKFQGDTLILTGENDLDSMVGLHRMSFSPLPDGGNRQYWELSTDKGATWTVIHDGTYRRADSR